MAKGNEAKANFIKRLATALGADYIGEVDKKYYVWSTENGERIQLAIALTCPKNPVSVEGNGGDLNFDDETATVAVTSGTISGAKSSRAQMDADERATLERLMKELDL